MSWCVLPCCCCCCCQVWRDELGDCYLQEPPSSCGTWLNGRRLHVGEKVRLLPQVIGLVVTGHGLKVSRAVVYVMQPPVCEAATGTLPIEHRSGWCVDSVSILSQKPCVLEPGCSSHLLTLFLLQDLLEFGAHPASEVFKVKMQHVSLSTGASTVTATRCSKSATSSTTRSCRPWLLWASHQRLWLHEQSPSSDHLRHCRQMCLYVRCVCPSVHVGQMC